MPDPQAPPPPADLSPPTADPADFLPSDSRNVSPDPEFIGHYRILQRIGEGGMGVVYVAEQREPIRRTVAVKVIKLGMDSREVVARFEAERQALALMSHPNVAKVFEAGVTETGRPFFAMEHVPGVPLTQYCDDNKLSVRDRLELFMQVCHAVQHAHQKGIIHRDLKPSNALVTLFDGKPVPKVIDFGIAKAATHQLTQRTLFTQTGSLIGTPEYMSPEQAQTGGLDVDTRSDVYSLGVILYELLTGSTPFDAKTLRGSGPEQMVRILRETEPPRPSARLTSADAGTGANGGDVTPSREIARRRGTDARSLRRAISGDLDWITLKAMEKDRTRRYDTATGLAMDVRRHLDNEPVLARPPSAVYRTRTFIRRHRMGVTAAALVALAMVAGVIGTSTAMVRARRAEREAIVQRNAVAQLLEDVTRARVAAQAQAARATAVSSFLQSVLESAQPDTLGGGSDAKVGDMLRSAELKIKAELADEPELEIQTRFTLFRTYHSLGMWPESWPNLDRAYDLVIRTHLEDTELGLRVIVAKARFGLNGGLASERAEAIARLATEPAQRVFGEEHELTLLADGTLATILATTREPVEQDALFQPIIQRFRRLAASPATDAAVALAVADYATMVSRRGEWSRAQSLCGEVLGFLRTRHRRDLPRELLTTVELVGTLRKQNKWAEAAEAYRGVLADVRPQLSDAQPEVQAAMANYAYVLRRAGKEAESAEVWRELMTFLNLAADSPATTPAALLSRGYIRARVGRFADSLADLNRVIEQDPSLEPAWWFRGCLLAYLGPPEQFAQHRGLMFDRFGMSNPLRVDERAAKMSLLLPGGDVARAEAIIDDGLPTATGRFLGWDQLTKAMAVYRAGRFRECLTWPARAASTLQNDAARVTANLFAAMSHWQLGDHALATQELDSAVAWVNQELPKAEVEDSAFMHSLDNWLILRVILREAESLIRPTAPGTQTGKN